MAEKDHPPRMITPSNRCYHVTTVGLMASFVLGPRLHAPQYLYLHAPCCHRPRRGCLRIAAHTARDPIDRGGGTHDVEE